ncbi:MAG: hypothetical protein LBR74_01800, partial [Eubacterium sp.]|nr:hypothetical protein [Eubacterium sp.]
MAKSKMLRFLSGTLASALILTTMTVELGVSAEISDLDGNVVEIISDDALSVSEGSSVDGVAPTVDGVAVEDGVITSGEGDLTEDNAASEEEILYSDGAAVGEETSAGGSEVVGEETSSGGSEVFGEEASSGNIVAVGDESSSGKETSSGYEDESSYELLADSDLFAPDGDKRLAGSTYVPYMPKATVIETNFNSFVGTQQGADNHGNFELADGVFEWIGKGTETNARAYRIEYNNLPYNKVALPGRSSSVEGEFGPEPGYEGEIDGVEILAAFDMRGSPYYSDRQKGGYWKINVPEGVTAAKFSIWAHGSGTDRIDRVRKGEDPLTGVVVGPGAYVPYKFLPSMAPDFQNEGSAENRPVKEDYYLPG